LVLNISEGERAVLEQLAEGRTRPEIATRLGVSLSTVNNRIYEAMARNESHTSYGLLADYIHDTYARAETPPKT